MDNPLFITNNVSPYDWRDPANNSLWQGVSGINNPCPTGFRVPTQPEWAALATAEGITNGTSDDKAFASTLKLTLAGVRYYSSGSLVNLGSGGYYWSSTPNGSRAYYLSFTSSSVNSASVYNRTYGLPVRCIKDY